MTNADRQLAAARAKALRAKFADQARLVDAADDAANTLAQTLRDLLCATTNAARAAEKVENDPTVASMRDLAASERHLEAFGRRRVRMARRALAAAMLALEPALVAPAVTPAVESAPDALVKS